MAEPVVRAVDRALAAAGLLASDGSRVAPAGFWVSAHIRHKFRHLHVLRGGEGDSRNASAADGRLVLPSVLTALRALEGRALATGHTTQGPRRHALLIASDRPVHVDVLQDIFGPHGITVASMDDAATRIEQHAAARRRGGTRGVKLEHGLRTGKEALLDLEMLSRGDGLLATARSTFSDIIAERMAARFRGTGRVPLVTDMVPPDDGNMPAKPPRPRPLLGDFTTEQGEQLRRRQAAARGSLPAHAMLSPDCRRRPDRSALLMQACSETKHSRHCH